MYGKQEVRSDLFTPRIGFTAIANALVAPSSSFWLLPVTQSEIEDEISNLNHNKSTGSFSVPTALL